MVTKIPTVKVSPVEGGQGFLITCDRCPNLRTVRSFRPEADLFARDHRAAHATPEPEEGDWF